MGKQSEKGRGSPEDEKISPRPLLAIKEFMPLSLCQGVSASNAECQGVSASNAECQGVFSGFDFDTFDTDCRVLFASNVEFQGCFLPVM